MRTPRPDAIVSTCVISLMISKSTAGFLYALKLPIGRNIGHSILLHGVIISGLM
jgi:hypothetical protein